MSINFLSEGEIKKESPCPTPSLNPAGLCDCLDNWMPGRRSGWLLSLGWRSPCGLFQCFLGQSLWELFPHVRSSFTLCPSLRKIMWRYQMEKEVPKRLPSLDVSCEWWSLGDNSSPGHYYNLIRSWVRTTYPSPVKPRICEQNKCYCCFKPLFEMFYAW